MHLLRRLRAEANGGHVADLFRPGASDVRFRLGTSLADLRIPFKLADGLRSLVDRATIDAYLLVAQRQRPALAPTEYDKLVLIEGFDPQSLRALTFSPPSAVTRDSLRRTFADALDGHALLDSGVVASFLASDRPGRTLAQALHALFAKARDEGLRSDTAEPTPYLVALMLRSVADRSFGLTRDAPIGEPHARQLRSMVAVLLSQVAGLALRESGMVRVAPHGPVPDTGRDPRSTRSALLTQASLGVLPFLGSRGTITQTGLSAYGIPFDGPPPRFEELVTRISRGDDPEVVASELAGQVAKEKELSRRLERAAAMASLRRSLRMLSRQLELVRSQTLQVPGEATLERLLVTRDGLEKLFASEPRRRDLLKNLKEFGKFAPGEDARQRLEAFAHALREFREDAPAGWLGPADARLTAARALVAYAADVWIDRQAAQAATLLLERSGAETEGGEVAEYDSGRLYLVTHEATPLLKARVGPPQVGHLFCDMKDFTRRTAFLKESVIADFLQREFYAPILNAASGHEPSSRGPAPSRAVTLNNLLGDAVSFSGDIAALVKLGRDIRTALRDYSRRLEQEASNEAVTEKLTELEGRYRQRHDAMERSVRELAARAPHQPPEMREGMLLRAREIRAELERLEATFAADRARAAGEKLEAGTFVSFGAAPEIARFDDPVFGAIKVAIAEKINESARGTARSGAVKAKVDLLLERARRATGRELVLPFRVLVDSPPVVPVPADATIALEEAQARGDKALAERILADVARKALAQPAGPGELYNAGTALSEEALAAYLDARSTDLVVLRREVAPADLHPLLRDRFFFPKSPLTLVLGLHPATRALAELYVFQGRVLFRGFEATGGLGVFEAIDSSDPFFTLLAAHQVPEWAKTP